MGVLMMCVVIAFQRRQEIPCILLMPLCMLTVEHVVQYGVIYISTPIKGKPLPEHLTSYYYFLVQDSTSRLLRYWSRILQIIWYSCRIPHPDILP